MNLLNNFHFIRPYALLLIPAVLIAWWFIKSRNDPFRIWRTVIDGELLQAMTINPDGWRNRQEIAMLLGWLLTAIAVAGPTWKPEPSPFADDPVPTMVLLKASESMLQSDLIPNRMELARLKVVDFCEQRKGQPVGLIAYAGTPHLVLPPTRDTAVVGSMATEIDPTIMPKPGDAVASAVTLAQSTLAEQGGSIVIVADTVAPDQIQELSSLKAAVRVQILGIARPDTPEETDLKKAASSLGAQLTLFTPDVEDVSIVAKRVSQTPIASSDTGEGTRWSEAGYWLVPVIAAFALLPFRREETSEESAS